MSDATGPGAVAGTGGSDPGDSGGRGSGSDASGRGSSAVVRRVGWGVLDQGISSLGNFFLGIMAARSLSAEHFGAFSLAFVTFSFIINASRGPSTDPLMVRFSGPKTPAWQRAVQHASGTALTGGLLAAAACLATGLVIGGDLGAAYLALAVGLPGILLQDSYRFAFFSRGQGKRAFVNDLVWAVLQTSGLLVLLAVDRVTITSCLLVFGGSATFAAGFGWWQLGLAPKLSGTRSWLVEQRTLGGRYFLENVAIGGARQVRIIIVGVVAGLTAVAELRAAEILMGPFMILLAGVSQVSVPEARSVLLRDPARVRRFCLTLAAAQAACAAAWSIAAITLLPLGPGELLLKDLWEPTERLLIPLALILILGCFETAAAAGLRALGASRRSLAAQLVSAALYVVLGGIGADLGGAWGSSWGVVAAMIVGLTVWWSQLTRGVGDRLRARGAPR